jgi:flagellar basal-body rod modification protein FlgD
MYLSWLEQRRAANWAILAAGADEQRGREQECWKQSKRRRGHEEESREQMAAMAGILNHQLTAGQALTGAGASPMASATSGAGASSDTSSSSSSSSSSATISANDFLTLLVTEMQNQDPTADTDPNEYINQLVSVNSLEQLIDINQNLTTSLGSSATPGATATSAQATSAPSSLTGGSVNGATAQAHGGGHNGAALTAVNSAASRGSNSGVPAAISQFVQAQGPQHAPGNLSIPKANRAAQRVGHSLGG